MRFTNTIIIAYGIFSACVAPNENKPAAAKYLNNLGLKYKLIELKEPIPNKIHILSINLSLNKVKPVVVLGEDPDGVGPAEAILTDPRKLASKSTVVAFVNTNPWDSFPDDQGRRNRNWYSGQMVDIQGLAGTGGKLRSSSAPNDASIWFDLEGNVNFGHQHSDKPREATTGFQLILSEGNPTVNIGGARHPRTAIGTDKKGKILWLVVVDGRQQNYSEGMNLHELANIMKDIGCWKATNMDGGGSSIMGLLDNNGKMKIMNSPSDRKLGKIKIRPLPMILTIKKSKN